MLGLLFDSEDGGDMFFRNDLTFKGLHDVISLKMVLSYFIHFQGLW
jgi:hypothetical protein